MADTSWIKPGKYIGVWWGMHLGHETCYQGERHGANTENMKRYIDFASRNNISAVLAEGWNEGWEERGNFQQMKPYSDYNWEEVAKYAHERGVDLVMHNETASDIPLYESQVEEAFKLYNKMGIHYVKGGYIAQIKPVGHHRHGQMMVEHYQRVVELAAKYQIMLNVHEPIKATGTRRTWPNMMTREGVMGMEFNAWSLEITPKHTTVIPFTRMLSGPLDYNLGVFDILYRMLSRRIFVQLSSKNLKDSCEFIRLLLSS